MPLTKVLAKAAQTEVKSAVFSFLNLGSGRTSNADFFVHNFNKIFSISSGCGQTEVYSQPSPIPDRCASCYFNYIHKKSFDKYKD